MKIIKIASVPKVGIFWLYKSGIISFMADARTEKAVGEWKDSPFDHFSKWDDVIKGYPELARKDYVDVPRGRVMYNAVRKTFRVMSSSTVVANKGDLVKIGREFSLPPSATEVLVDAHYEMEEAFDYDQFNADSGDDFNDDDSFEPPMPPARSVMAPKPTPIPPKAPKLPPKLKKVNQKPLPPRK